MLILKKISTHFKNLTIKARLQLGFGLILFFLIFISISNLLTMGLFRSIQKEVSERDLAAQLANGLSASGDTLYAILASTVISKNVKDGEQEFKFVYDDIVTNLDKVKMKATTKEEEDVLKEVKNNFEQINTIAQKDLFPLIKSNAPTSDITIQISKASDIRADIRKNMGFTVSFFDDANQKVLKKMTSISLFGTILTSTLLFFSIIVAFFSSRFIIKQIMEPISEISNASELMAQGDFTIDLSNERRDEFASMIESFKKLILAQKEKSKTVHQIAEGDFTVNVHLASEKDELGHSLKIMIEKLKDLLASIQEISTDLSHKAIQVGDSSQSLSQTSTQQASALEEISSSMHIIDIQTKTNSENASKAKVISDEARSVSSDGQKAMEKTMGMMTGMEESSEKIKKIIKVIDELAFQTNLLALNAAVEAARAGKHGKGFAVVAEEVRNLASRSAKAAKETAELIETNVKNVNEVRKVSQYSRDSFDGIVLKVNQLAEYITAIAKSGHEQSTGIAQITTGISQVDQVVQKNTASSEELASSSKELAHQAEELSSILKKFKID